MIEAIVEKSENLLKVTYVGHITAEATRKSLDLVQPLVVGMQQGFRLLSDLRGLESMDLGCVPFIEKVMDLCNERGIAMVVRIIPDPKKDIGLNIMSLFHYRRGVRIVTCKTIEEAEAALASGD